MLILAVGRPDPTQRISTPGTRKLRGSGIYRITRDLSTRLKGLFSVNGGIVLGLRREAGGVTEL
jgi:hypothetical protein